MAVASHPILENRESTPVGGRHMMVLSLAAELFIVILWNANKFLGGKPGKEAT